MLCHGQHSLKDVQIEGLVQVLGTMALILLQADGMTDVKDEDTAEKMVLVEIDQCPDDEPHEDPGHQAGELFLSVSPGTHIKSLSIQKYVKSIRIYITIRAFRQ